jgi:hypothetical protein
LNKLFYTLESTPGAEITTPDLIVPVLVRLSQGGPEAVAVFIKRYPQVLQHRVAKNGTLLHLVAQEPTKFECVELLVPMFVKLGLDVRAKNDENMTALDLASAARQNASMSPKQRLNFINFDSVMRGIEELFKSVQ